MLAGPLVSCHAKAAVTIDRLADKVGSNHHDDDHHDGGGHGLQLQSPS